MPAPNTGRDMDAAATATLPGRGERTIRILLWASARHPPFQRLSLPAPCRPGCTAPHAPQVRCASLP